MSLIVWNDNLIDIEVIVCFVFECLCGEDKVGFNLLFICLDCVLFKIVSVLSFKFEYYLVIMEMFWNYFVNVIELIVSVNVIVILFVKDELKDCGIVFCCVVGNFN